MQKAVKRNLYITGGTLSTGVGIAGIFIPVLPTTPFLLLAAYCYMRSSSRLYNWLLNNRLFGAYITNYIEGKGMPLVVKIITILILWISISLTISFAVEHVAIRTILILIAVGVTLHVSLIKTKKT